MKRKLFFANLLLLALIAAGAVHLRREWTAAHLSEQQVLRKKLPAAPAPRIPALPVIEPVKPALYGDIAQKMLFSKDRNPVVVVVPPPPPKAIPMPALPLFHGVVDLGDGPMAIMSEGPKAPHRDYQPGDKIGAFKLMEINDDELVLEWEGQTITKKFDEFIDRTTPPPPAPVTASAATAAPPAPPRPVVKAAAAPGSDLNGGVRACQPGDSSPAGTVADGWRKVIKGSPFGARCFWESDK